MKKYIRVKTNFVGYHRWMDAPDSTAFLRDFHRHIFYVDVTIEVTGFNRELEFFAVKKELDKYIGHFADTQFDSSCEQIAEGIYTQLSYIYGKDRKYIIEVSEDGESSGIVISE